MIKKDFNSIYFSSLNAQWSSRIFLTSSTEPNRIELNAWVREIRTFLIFRCVFKFESNSFLFHLNDSIRCIWCIDRMILWIRMKYQKSSVRFQGKFLSFTVERNSNGFYCRERTFEVYSLQWFCDRKKIGWVC